MHLVVRILLVASLLFSGWVVLHRQVARRIVDDRGGVEGRLRALAWDPENSDLYNGIGVRYLRRPELNDPQLALGALERAVMLNPYSPRFRLDLAHAYETIGWTERAEEAFKATLALKPGSPDYHWALANFYARAGKLEAALPHLRAALEVRPLWDWDHSLRKTCYTLLTGLGAPEEQIERAWPSDTASRRVLLQLLTEDEDSTIGFDFRHARWLELLRAEPPISIAEGGFFIRYLSETERVELARQEWIRLTGANGVVDRSFEDKSNFVWNGEFELPIEEAQHPLEWHLVENDVVSVRQVVGEGVDGSSALQVRFRGIKNIDFLSEMTVVVDPAAPYEMTLSIRSRELTTDQGVYVEIRDAASWELLVSTTPILGTAPYRESSASFPVPEGSRLLVLRLRRNPSRRLDNKVSGTVWLDSVRLRRVGVSASEEARFSGTTRP